jgi:precorrin-2 dehydrogenase/sirohydrochlorin ferrochelatase
MDAFPAFIPLKGRRVIVVGAGEMADGKADLFTGSPAELVRRPFDAAALYPELYTGFHLVFIAAPDDGAGAAAAAAARAAGAMLVNVVDRPHLCDFYTPALVDRGSVVAAVGTTGSGPMLAQRLKGAIAAVMPQGLGALADLLKELQGDVRARFPDFPGRRAFLTTLLDGPVAEAALEGRIEEARGLARAALQGAATTSALEVHVPTPGLGEKDETDDNGEAGRDDRIP